MNKDLIIAKQKELIECMRHEPEDNQLGEYLKFMKEMDRLESELCALESETEPDKEHQIIYIAMYNPMIYESTYRVISLHRTRKDAEIALAFHKEEKRKEWLEMYPTEDEQKESPFGKYEAWNVFEEPLK